MAEKSETASVGTYDRLRRRLRKFVKISTPNPFHGRTQRKLVLLASRYIDAKRSKVLCTNLGQTVSGTGCQSRHGNTV